MSSAIAIVAVLRKIQIIATLQFTVFQAVVRPEFGVGYVLL